MAYLLASLADIPPWRLKLYVAMGSATMLGFWPAYSYHRLISLSAVKAWWIIMPFFYSHRLWRIECTFQWSDQHQWYNIKFHGNLQLWPWLHPGWWSRTYMPVQWAVVWFTAFLQWWVIFADSQAKNIDITLKFVTFRSHWLWRFEYTFQWSDQHHWYNIWFHGHLQLWPWLHPGW